MSKHREDITLPVAADDAVSFALRAVEPLTRDGWKVADVGPSSVELKEPFKILTTGNRATVKIHVWDEDGRTCGLLFGENLGWGPLQDRYVRNRVQEVRTALLRAASAPSAETAATPAPPPQEEPPQDVPPRDEPSREGPRTVPMPPPRVERRIFISYRRKDSAYITGRICDRLEARFGRGSLYRDVDSIPMGVDFRAHLDEALAGSRVLLAIIGDEWLKTRDGRQRLHEDNDYVRFELETALERKIPVVPVLIENATVPDASDLPASLQSLVYYHAAQVRQDPDFDPDVEKLVQGLERFVVDAPSGR